MADRNKYPQIPSTVWWGVRSILNKTPKITIDERLLGVQLEVQETAARTYIGELRQVGILAEDGKATPLAERWRLDDTYQSAVQEIIKEIYPENLIHLGPEDRPKIISWFQREGFGEGAARNKAATFLLISSSTPIEAGRIGAKSTQSGGSGEFRASRPRIVKQTGAKGTSRKDNSESSEELQRPRTNIGGETIPLNVNVQIHISADAGSDQIHSIFQAMRRYLYEPSDT